jgi:hypothetical protein
VWHLCEPRETPALLWQVPETLLLGVPQSGFDQKEQVSELFAQRSTHQTTSKEYSIIVEQGTNILQELR